MSTVRIVLVGLSIMAITSAAGCGGGSSSVRTAATARTSVPARTSATAEISGTAGASGSGGGADSTGGGSGSSGAATGAGGGDGGGTQSAGEEPAGSPSAEPSGPEVPAPPARPKPKIEVASLPIGGSADTTDAPQCVQVSYLGPTAMPAAARLVVTAAVILPREEFYQVGGSGCSGGQTHCLSAGFAFTADNVQSDSGRCSVPIRGTGARGTSTDTAALSVKAEVRCPDVDFAACAAFADGLQGNGQTISLEVQLRPDSPPPSSSASAPVVPSATSSPSDGASATTAPSTAATR